MGIVGEGLEQCRTYLNQARVDRDAMYLDMAMNPEKYAAPETEPVAEPAPTAEETLAPAA